MNGLHRLGCALLGAFSSLAAWPVTAHASGCEAIAVQTDGTVSARWPELAGSVRDSFASREGVEPCARVMLAKHETGIRIEVTLADGRSTSRSVAERADVIPVLQALLLVPTVETASFAAEALPPAMPAEPESHADAPRRPQAPRSRPKNRVAPFRVAERDAALTPAVTTADGLGFELSAFGSARVGDGWTSGGVGLLSFVDLFGWLAGFEGRADGYNQPGAPPGGALTLALLGGRRFRYGTRALDLFAGPALMLHGASASVEAGPAGKFRETSSGALARVVFGSHLHFATDSLLRTFVGLAGEVGQTGELETSRDGSHEAPGWMLGVRLGATVGTR